jgi:hypothetical protein
MGVSYQRHQIVTDGAKCGSGWPVPRQNSVLMIDQELATIAKQHCYLAVALANICCQFFQLRLFTVTDLVFGRDNRISNSRLWRARPESDRNPRRILLRKLHGQVDNQLADPRSARFLLLAVKVVPLLGHERSMPLENRLGSCDG